MTFDEATENINVLSAFSTVYGISPTVVRDIISKLKEEYAPTVEMTVFDRTNAVGLLDFKRDELTFVVGSNGDGTPILDTLPKEYFSAWLHPETIKIVDK